MCRRLCAGRQHCSPCEAGSWGGASFQSSQRAALGRRAAAHTLSVHILAVPRKAHWREMQRSGWCARPLPTRASAE